MAAPPIERAHLPAPGCERLVKMALYAMVASVVGLGPAARSRTATISTVTLPR